MTFFAHPPYRPLPQGIDLNETLAATEAISAYFGVPRDGDSATVIATVWDSPESWYAAVHAVMSPGLTRTYLLRLLLRTTRDPSGGLHREVGIFVERDAGPPAACLVPLLALTHHRNDHRNIRWRVACLVDAVAQCNTPPTTWRGVFARTLRALDPRPVSAALTHRWSAMSDPMLRTALVRRRDLPTTALSVMLDRWDGHDLAVAILTHPNFHPTLTPKLLRLPGAYWSATPSPIDTLLAHPDRARLMDGCWHAAAQGVILHGNRTSRRRVLSCPDCPASAYAVAMGATASDTPLLRGVRDTVRGDVSRVARVRLFRRPLSSSDWMTVFLVALPALRASDLARLLRDRPAPMQALVRSLLRASSNPAIVAAVTAPI